MPETLYDFTKSTREGAEGPSYRVMLAAQLREPVNVEEFMRETMKGHDQLKGYLFARGTFYIHILESHDIDQINNYLKEFHHHQSKHNTIRVVHQSYESPLKLFKGWECDANMQAGPNLNQCDKTKDQIQDRSFQIYSLFMDGASKKKESNSYKIGTMVVLSNDDMSMLVCPHFMSLQEYVQLYIEEMQMDRESERNYPLPPTIFDLIEFLEIEEFDKFSLK